MKFIRLPLFWCLWYLAFSTRSIISPYLPIIEDEFGINHATAGGLYLFAAAGTTLTLSITAFVARYTGYKRLITVSFFLAAGSLVGLYHADAYWAFAMGLFLFGAGGGFYLPCAIPILTSFIRRQNWGKAIAFHETAAGFSIVSIPVIAAYTMVHMPWRNIFLFLSGLFAIIALTFWALSPDPRPQKIRSTKQGAVLKRFDFWIISALWITSAIGAMGVYSIVPLFLVHDKGMAVDTANRILGISRIGGLCGQICIGFFLDRYDFRKILFFLTLASGLSAVGLSMARTEWLLFCMLLLQATFCVVFFPVGIVAIAKLTQPDERSVFTGTIMAISGLLSLGLAPVFLGAVADAWNFGAGIFIIGLMAIAASWLVRLLGKS